MDFIINEMINMSFIANENLQMTFGVNENIYMDFILREEFTSKYANLETTGKVKIDSTMNYLRYKRIEEIGEQTIGDILEKTIKDITEEEG